MKIAFVGIKGLPARGGAERVVEGIITRLIPLGVEPTVYCDRSYTPAGTLIPGVKLIRLPVLPGKYLRSTSLNILAALHAVFRGCYDLIHLHNIEASFVLPLLRLRYKVISTSHGAAYWRAKWGPVAKRLIRLMDVPFVRWSTAVTFVSAKDAREFQRRFGRETVYIPNGVGLEYLPDRTGAQKILAAHGLMEKQYLLFVAGRIEPTKGAHLAIEAVNRLENRYPLLVVGDLSQVLEYGRQLKAMAGPNVRFQGLVEQRETLFGLMAGATCLVFPSLVEAMSMVLLEAASIGVPVVCSDISENLEFMGADAIYFDPAYIESLIEQLRWLLAHEQESRQIADRAKARIRAEYSWDIVAARYDELYRACVSGAGGLA
jgi:glycosyltransferase involved in cell wall biosynthesis